MAASERGGQIDLTQLSAQQLSQVKKQLDDEVQHLTGSYQNLRGAQQKFRDCIVSIKNGVANSVKGELREI
jgi:prefoldin alpha subunit